MKSLNNLQEFAKGFSLALVVLVVLGALLIQYFERSVPAILLPQLASFIAALRVSYIYKRRWNVPYRETGRWRDAALMAALALTIYIAIIVVVRVLTPGVLAPLLKPVGVATVIREFSIVYLTTFLAARIGIGASNFLATRDEAKR